MKKFLIIFFLPFYIFSSDIIIVTAAIGDRYKNIVYPGIVSKLSYCKKNRYDLFVLDQNIDPTRPLQWAKILIIKKLLSNYKYVFWSDADSLIMNDCIRLEELFEEKDGVDMHICIDKLTNIINSGQFFIRNSPKSFKFLDDVYKCEYAIHHIWWENKAIIDLLNTEEYFGFANLYEQRRFNSYGNNNLNHIPSVFYQKGDFIVHFPSINNEELKNLMYEYGKDFIYPIKIPMNTVIYN